MEMALSLPPPGGRVARVRQEAAPQLFPRPWERGERERAHTLQLWRGPAALVFLYLSFDVTGLFDPFHSRATQSWVWVVLKKNKRREDSLVVNEIIAMVSS